MNNRKISIVIPIYNAEKYLKEALNSVINQTYQNLEILCINDGSTDNSLSIIKDYIAKDNRIKLIDKKNSGYGASVNLGINNASGEYIAIFEPDDILEPNIYETLYKEISENNLNVVKCNFYFYWARKNKLKKSGLITECSNKNIFKPKNNLKIFTCHASVWAALYRKDFLDKNNIRFLETSGASFQDMSFNFKVLSLTNEIKLLKTPLLKYRQDNSASSVNNPNKIYCVCDEYDEITTFLNNNPNLKKDFNSQKLINQYRAYKWNLNRLDKSLREEFLQKFSETFKRFSDNSEITNEFYKSISKRDFNLLINSPFLYYDKIVNKNRFYWLKLFRNKKNEGLV